MREIDLKKQNQDYEKTLSSVIKKIEESKHKAITTVNKLLIELYWFIGDTLVNLQEKSKWGAGVVEKLSQDLRMKYPEQNGFSVQNLWHMKKFYLTYHDKPILQTLSGELSWSHNVIILDKTKTTEEKEFYLRMSIKERWSFRELRRQIDSAYFERFALSQKPDKLMKIEQDKLAIPFEEERDRLAEQVFRGLIEQKVLWFFLLFDKGGYKLPSRIKVKKISKSLIRQNNTPIQRSLFDFVPDEEFNEMEKSVAIYLDEQEKLLWWYRNLSRQDYYVQGWKKHKIYPDFIFADTDEKKQEDYNKIYIVETKGLHLKNEDTDYKKNISTFCKERFFVFRICEA